MKSWWLAGLAALTLGSAAFGQEAPADTVINTPAPVPAPLPALNSCAPITAPAGALCVLVGTANIPRGDDMTLSWALYEIVTGAGRSGISALLVGGDVAAQTPLPIEAIDRWRREPYVLASIIKRGDTDYAVMMAPGDETPAAFSVYRIGAGGWVSMDTSGLWPAIGAKLTTVAGPQCYPVSSDISWRAFALRYGMVSDDGACGAAIIGLGIENDAVTVVDAMAVKPDLTPVRRSRGRRR